MPEFRVVSDYQPTGDQPHAIAKLVEGVRKGDKHQTLLGVTGSGKSLDADEPVYLARFASDGSWSNELVPIGRFVDELLRDPTNVESAADGTLIRHLTNELFRVVSFNPKTGRSEPKVVTAVTRHSAPTTMYRLQTSCGRSVLVTGDHSVWVLREGQLMLLPTSEVRVKDYLPLPEKLDIAETPLRHLNLLDLLAGENVYVRAGAAFRKVAAATSVKNVIHAFSGHYRDPYVKWYFVANSKPGGAFALKDYATISAGLGIPTTPPSPSDDAEDGSGVDGVTVSCLSPYELPARLPLTDELLRFFGHYLAEGNCQHQFVIIASRCSEVRDDVQRAMAGVGLKAWVRPNTDMQISSKLWCTILRRLFGARAREKHLPPFWPQLAPGQLGQLLRAYFEGDGGVEEGGVCACTASEQLASDLLYALLSFGIWARLRRVWKRATNSAHCGDWYWMVSISSQQNLRRFAENVGFLSERKQAALQKILNREPDTNVDVLPGCGQLIREAREAAGLRQLDLAQYAGIDRSALSMIENGQRRPRRETARRLVTGLRQEMGERAEEIVSVRALETLVHGAWTPIVSVEKVAYDRPYVYDLTVADNETFVAGRGGLFVHNTFTMAKCVEQLQRPTLVIAHNKTLAAQLASEFREFFPDNAVEYFVSYYDYYQPEAYVARTDTYIEKDATINDDLDRLRHAATQALFTRRDVLIVASVSCIYSLGEPEEYDQTTVRLKVGETRNRDKLLRWLTDIYYERNDYNFTRGKIRVRGDAVEVFPAYEEIATRIEFWGDEIERIVDVDPLTGEILLTRTSVEIYPAKHFVTSKEKLQLAVGSIEAELVERLAELEGQGKLLEAERLRQRTNFDLEMLRETGVCAGIENYARHLSQREPGSMPWTLLDYFPDDFVVFIDESHITLPQVRGMYHGDKSRKEVLIDYGFRLPSALDNRPLTFQEFERHMNQVVYVSATPGPYEYEHSQQIVEQVIRPTGLVDPSIEVRPTTGQIDDLIQEIRLRIERGERALVTTLTKKMAEDLADYLREVGIKVHYLHSEIETLERIDILRDLRLGVYDVVVGINLLREGLDLPEVSLVAILDADKEGFLRSEGSLIQTIGRAARHVQGQVVMYADNMTDSMKRAIDETYRRRKIQLDYNEAHGIVPVGIHKAVKDITDRVRAVAETKATYSVGSIPKDEARRMLKDLEAEMKAAAKELEFERAAQLRDQIAELRRSME